MLAKVPDRLGRIGIFIIQFSPDQFQPAVYKSVVEDVINGVRETFLDEGCDEQILQELKQVE